MGKVCKKILLGVSLVSSVMPVSSFACSDLVGLENKIAQSNAPMDKIMVSSSSRLGYGLNPLSYHNTDTVRLFEKYLGRPATAKFIAAEIRESMKVADNINSRSVKIAEDIYPNTYGINMTQRMLIYRELAKAADPLQDYHPHLKYSGEVFKAMVARKHHAAITVQRYNIGEVLSDFWFNHFNVAVNGSSLNRLFGPDYELALRKNTCKTFYDMLLASAKHPAMNVFLDNNRNSKKIVNKSGAVVADVNENYGREVIELHTIGSGPIHHFDANGNPVYAYYQKEVYEAARVLTGWNMQLPKADGSGQVAFFFNDARNDTGKKVFDKLFQPVSGKVTIGAGQQEAERFLKLLAMHPLTKRNICTKLGAHLMGFKPPQTLVNKCVAAYGTVGNLPKMYEAYLVSDEFWSPNTLMAGFKTPFEWTSSMLRALGFANKYALIENEKFLVGTSNSMASSMGFQLYSFGPPTGYPVGLLDWASPQYVNGSIAAAFKASPYLQVSFNGKKDLALEKFVSNLPGSSSQDKANRQFDMVTKNIVPVFAGVDPSVLKNKLVLGLTTGKEDKLGKEKLPLRTIVVQSVSSGYFYKK
ncbi:MAG: DUF1800 domain-containing protein [Oligoflexia bacterium]|nr:DUF1800 domain-containing protein [Oligoflexia bacterium]